MNLSCSSCHKPNASTKHEIKCEVCHGMLCKDCVKYLEESFFSFLKNVPKELGHLSYCWACFDQHVVPVMEPYLEIMARAREVYVFTKNDKNVPVIKRSRSKISVEDCPDKAETILRLAFFAAQESCNAVVDMNLLCKKVRINGYQKANYSATGVPALIRVSSLRENIT